ncbi:MAG: hypothetical protein P1U41_02750 [Vicingaceae bacterium]|nr:hypothetical protein [Vicingaceae bacterium]
MRKNYIKLSLILVSMLFVEVGVAQEVEGEVKLEEVKEEKKKEKKEKKDDGKIHKSGKEDGVIKYRRSSLHTMIIEDANLPKKDLIVSTFNEAPFPDKYNDHTVGDKSFDLATYQALISTEETDDNKKKDKDLSPAITKYFQDNKVANKIIAKWFNQAEDGAFDMSLIQDRGAYDASSQDIAKAGSMERGVDMLKDAGIDLLGNTFVVVNYSKFVSNEEAAKVIYDIAVARANKMGELGKSIKEVAKAAYEKAREGYSVWTTAYLYQLEWNDSTEAVFYMDMWMDSTSVDPAKKELFENSDLFQLKLLGYQKAKALVTGLGSNAENETMIVKNATLKSINSVYNKLQRKFEAFRTKTPLVSADPLGAKIGMKEGLEGGDKYEVLMQEYGKDGKLTYKRKGVIKVDKKKIWDNRYAAGEEPLDDNGNPVEPENDLEFTHFKGGKGFFPGMLIRQIN